MSKQNIYDVFKRPNGLLYRVPLYSPLHKHAEVYSKQLLLWVTSGHKVGGIVSSNRSTLVVRNVVFKDKACSQ